MKNIFFIIFIIFIFPVLVRAQQEFKISGILDNQNNEKITITYFDGTNNITHAVDAVNGNFLLTGPAPEEPVIAILNTGVDRRIFLGEPNKSMFLPAPPLNIVLSKNSNLVITGNAKVINMANVAGDEYNESFNSLRKIEEKYTIEMANLQKEFAELKIMQANDGLKDVGEKMLNNRQQLVEVQKTFIKEHPSYYSSVWLLSTISKEYDYQGLNEAFNGLDAPLQKTSYGEIIASRIKIMATVANGSQAPEFSKPDLNGNLITLSQLKGKYVLIDFWGSWCGPCRASNPHLKELYNAYKDKGFEILGIACEKAKDINSARQSWKKAVETDGLPWLQVINNEENLKVDVTKLYGIDGYPTKVLLDKNGNIVAKWLGSESKELDDKLKAIFEK